MLVIVKSINAKYKICIIFFMQFCIAIFRFFCCKIDAYKGSILVYFRYTCPNRQYIDLWMYIYMFHDVVYCKCIVIIYCHSMEGLCYDVLSAIHLLFICVEACAGGRHLYNNYRFLDPKIDNF